MSITIRYNGSGIHLQGISASSPYTGTGDDNETGVVAYYAENACGSLTRNGYRMATGNTFETATEALEGAREMASYSHGRKVCKFCEKAAQRIINETADETCEAHVMHETSNITNGGKVHVGIRREAANGAVWYESRCGAGYDRTGTRQHRSFKVTESEVSCKTCLKITAAEQPAQAEEPFNYSAKFVELDELVKIDNQVVAAGYSREEYNVAAISEIVRDWKRNQDVDAFTFEGLLDFIASRHQLTR